MTKKTIIFVFAGFVMLSIPACKHKTVQAETPAKKIEAADKPTLEIKEKLFIAQTNDVYLNPEEYMGRRIKLEGLFKTDSYTGSDQSYCFVLRYGPGCCGFDGGTAGFEVSWPDNESSAYPKEDDWVEVVGILDSYEEDGYPYIYLSLESLKTLDERGAETVLH